MVSADLTDAPSLKVAFQGANIIFSVINYWEPFARPDCREAAKAEGINCRRYAYNTEYEHGKSIADTAATTVNSLDEIGFLVSTLSQGEKCSGKRYKDLYHYDAKADIFPTYVLTHC